MLPALKLAHEVMTREEETALIALIEGSGLAYSPYDPGNSRSSTSYGWKYDFASDGFVPCAPMPEGFARIAARAAEFAGVRVENLAECLLNRYEPGAVIQPHFDKPVWEHVVGVSLGASATMEFRREVERDWQYASVELPPRSMYICWPAIRATSGSTACRRYAIRAGRSHSVPSRMKGYGCAIGLHLWPDVSQKMASLPVALSDARAPDGECCRGVRAGPPCACPCV